MEERRRERARKKFISVIGMRVSFRVSRGRGKINISDQKKGARPYLLGERGEKPLIYLITKVRKATEVARHRPSRF